MNDDLDFKVDFNAAEAAVAAQPPQSGSPIAAYQPTEAALAELAQQYKGVVYDLSTSRGDKEARLARKTLTGLRTALESKRRQLKAPALEYSRRIDSEAARITAAIVALEDPIAEQIKADERRREDERQARAQAEQRRIELIQDAIAKLRAIPADAYRPETTVEQLDAHIKLLVDFKIEPTEFDEFTQQAVTAQGATVATLRELRTAALARSAEAQRVAAERAELERLRAADAERERIERERLEAEQKAERERLEAQRIEQARIAEEQAARQRELDSQAAEQARKRQADFEAAEREADRQRPVQDLQAAAARERLAEAMRRDAMAADRLAKAAPLMLAALLAVREWDTEPNALPEPLYKQINAAIDAATEESPATTTTGV